MRKPLQLGFTGTSKRMSMMQEDLLKELFYELPRFRLHHGDCVVADEFAHNAAMALGYPIEIHPPTNPEKRAFCEGAKLVRPPLPYLERNHQIVHASHTLIACPGTTSEILRSGTWATVRHARRHIKGYIYIIWPDGGIDIENV